MPESKIDIDFADGTYTFALPLPRIEEVQQKCGIGIGGLFARVLKGFVEIGDEIFQDHNQAQFYALDIVEPIRQGLIGGNHGFVNGVDIAVSPALADRLIQNYVADRPLTDSWSLSASILAACIKGYTPPKKAPPAAAPARKPRKKAG